MDAMGRFQRTPSVQRWESAVFRLGEDLGTTQTLADASCRAAENIATVELPVQEAIPRGDGGDVFRGGGVVDG